VRESGRAGRVKKEFCFGSERKRPAKSRTSARVQRTVEESARATWPIIASGTSPACRAAATPGSE